jgi:hypothetical protein
LKKSKLSELIEEFLQNKDNGDDSVKSVTILNNNRKLAWAEMDKNGYLKVTNEILQVFGVYQEDMLLL